MPKLDPAVREYYEKDKEAKQQWVDIAQTAVGKQLIQEAKDNVVSSLNRLYQLAQLDPEPIKLVSAIYALQQNSALLKKFTNAKDDVEAALKALYEDDNIDTEVTA